MSDYTDAVARKERATEKLAREVATILGDGWKTDPVLKHEIIHPDGRFIIFRVDTYGETPAKRYVISTWVRADDNYGSHSFSKEEKAEGIKGRYEITVAVTKTPEKIAKDVERRILTGYDKAMEKQREHIAQAMRQQANVEAVLRTVAAEGDAIGAYLSGRRGRLHDQVSLASNDRLTSVYGSFEYSAYSSSFRVELHGVSPETARRMMRAIAGE